MSLLGVIISSIVATVYIGFLVNFFVYWLKQRND